MTYDVEHLFICLFAIYTSSFVVSILIFFFKIEVFFLLNIKSSLYILHTNPLSDMFFKHFLPVCGLSFHSLNDFYS